MEALKRIWHDPVWSKVIAAAVVALGTIIAGYFLDWWPKLGAALAERTPVPNWLLALLGIAGATIVILIVAVLLAWLRRDNSVNPEWHSYTSDHFLGLRWRWRYLDGGQPFNIVSFCPNCDLQIHPQPPSGYHSIDRVAFYCESCSRLVAELDESVASLEDKIARFVQQKLRNGSWPRTQA